jgi:hypothetical protein
MKKILLSTLAAASLLATEDDWVMNNALSVWAEGVYLRHNIGHQQTLFFDGTKSACKSHRMLTRFEYEPGFRVGMAYMTRHTVLAATYLWVNQWESSCKKHHAGQINFSDRLGNLTGDYANADKGEAFYTSQFQNAELNYFYYLTPRRGNPFTGGWLVGARYIDFPEHLELKFIKTTSRSGYKIDIDNKIGALQIGAMLGWNPTDRLSWEGVGKVGMGADFCRQHTDVKNDNNTTTVRNYTRGVVSSPLVVAGSLSLTYLVAQYFNLHASYELIYLNGVATAPVQVNKSVHAPHRIKADGYALFHGWFFGLTFSF